MQVRIARPTRDLRAAVDFYHRVLGFPLLGEFADHDGFDGAIVGLPDASRQLELVAHGGVEPSPTSEDQLVLYLGSGDEVRRLADALESARFSPSSPLNPYWEREGASCFVDPDGYWLILSPGSW